MKDSQRLDPKNGLRLLAQGFHYRGAPQTNCSGRWYAHLNANWLFCFVDHGDGLAAQLLAMTTRHPAKQTQPISYQDEPWMVCFVAQRAYLATALDVMKARGRQRRQPHAEKAFSEN